MLSNSYDNIQWVVQNNLTSQEDLEGLRASFLKIGVKHIEIGIIPFSLQLPEFARDIRCIFYGSTTFMQLIENTGLKEGLFFDSGTFSIENYFDKWGDRMLNYSAMVTTFKELMSFGHAPDKLLFVRPDDDSKSFSGEVVAFNEIKDWYEKLITVENAGLSLDSKIVVSEPFNIQYEWRLWIVNRKVVAASKYREYFQLKKERGCPEEVIHYAEQRCLEYTPHDVFVMDVCLCGDEYYIVECGCMNAAGFYKADIDRIVYNVTEYFRGIS